MGRYINIFWMILLILIATGCREPITQNEGQSEGRVAFIANYIEGHDKYGDYIVSMNSDGSNQVELARWAFLTEDHSYLWSRDGTSFAYLEGEEKPSGVVQIYPSWLATTNAEGSERRQVLDLTGLEVTSISLSPDGQTVLLECAAVGGRLLNYILPGVRPII